jgi:hypothetical protein
LAPLWLWADSPPSLRACSLSLSIVSFILWQRIAELQLVAESMHVSIMHPSMNE